MWRALILTAAIVCAVSADAAAQIVQRPTRPYRGLFGGGPPPDPARLRQDLTLTGSFLAGYDTWLSPSGTSGSVDPTEVRNSGGALMGEMALDYFRGRTERSISVDGRIRTNGYSGIAADATIGGLASASAETNLGRVTRLRLSQDIEYVPTLVLGGQPALDIDLEAPAPTPVDVTSGYLEERSWSSSSFVSLDRRWSARQTTMVGAAYSRLTYLDNLGNDSRTISANATHGWSLNQRSSIRALYAFSDSNLESSDGLTTPMTTQSVELSFGYARRLSPSRQLQVNVDGGATHVSTLNALDRSDLAYWTPSGRGSVSWDVGRSWSIAGDYSRSTSVLQGVSVTSFATDSASASVSGLITSRLELSLSTAYSNGRSGGADTSGRFENYSGSLQLLSAISRCCATTVNYDYFVYRFQDVSDLPSGFPPDFDRQAIRVGFTIWLPLYGTYVDGGSTRGTRRN